MWVTKLLISPVKKRIFCPKTTKFGPKLAFLVNLGQALLVGRLVVVARGLFLARHLFTLLLLPVFTYFTFESNFKCCSTDKTDSRKEVEISFSVRATICNALVSTAAAVLAGFSTQEGNEGMIRNAILIVISAIPTMICLHTNHSLHCCSPHLPPLFLNTASTFPPPPTRSSSKTCLSPMAGGRSPWRNR